MTDPTVLVEAALDRLCGNYIFPDKARAAAAAVRRDLAGNRFEGLDEPALCERLTDLLFEHCADRHLRVRPARHADATTYEETRAAHREQSRLDNYGIAKVERLDGNIGLLDLRSVPDPQTGAPAIAAAMTLVAHTHALIIDLRNNGGGSPHGVAFWNSYFFPDENTHLNDIHDGASGRVREFWTLAYVPGERYVDRPLYLLIGGETFSAGEEFANNLKVLGRATLVGGTTRGGAHPTRPFVLSRTVEITVPVARAVNPVTGTNWEGTGVEPDVAVPAGEAFDVAYRMALTRVPRSGDSDAARPSGA